jgi:hypothetical protein
MLEPVIIMGITIALIEVIKTFYFWLFKSENADSIFKVLSPFVIIGIGTGLNILNAGIFGEGFYLEVIKMAAREGIIFTAAASGVYGLGKAAIEGSMSIKYSDKIDM